MSDVNATRTCKRSAVEEEIWPHLISINIRKKQGNYALRANLLDPWETLMEELVYEKEVCTLEGNSQAGLLLKTFIQW